MGWADRYIAALTEGRDVQCRPSGNSMSPRIRDGDLVTLTPTGDRPVRVGDVVLCRVRGRQYLHEVKAERDGRYLIGNRRGHLNGWVAPHHIYGRVTRVGGTAA